MTHHGIYFDLPEDEYHADPALGSTDMKLLATQPEEFWHRSKLNPDWKPSKPTLAQAYGTAAHKIMLEGVEIFNSRYGRCHYQGNIKAGKAEREDMREAGKLPIAGDDYERLMLSYFAIERHPFLKDAVKGGAGAEVSVFWECPRSSIRKKARFDRLKLHAIIDLKTFSPDDNVPFPTACKRAIGHWNYHVQAEHYCEARRQLAPLIEEGCVFGQPHCTDLELVAIAQQKRFAWVFVFLQSKGAPLIQGFTLSNFTDDDGNIIKNPILEAGASVLLRAEENWRTYTTRFGQRPWIMESPLEELSIDDPEFPRSAFV